MILDEIAAHTRKLVLRLSPAELKAQARDADPPRPFSSPSFSIIAEIKRATPRGPLAPRLDAAKQARAYAGAAALSVLTCEKYFHTTLDDLRAARAAVGLPVLRKEFVVHEAQIWETRAAGADALLLIVRLLERAQLRDYLALMHELGLAALVEVHTEREIDAALDAGAPIIGINNRNLDTFQTDLETSILLRPKVPAGIPTVSESGIASRKDVELLAAAGFDAALVGEALIAARDPARKLKELLNAD